MRAISPMLIKDAVTQSWSSPWRAPSPLAPRIKEKTLLGVDQLRERALLRASHLR
jgi:hypothetical protein